jgi:hypothetical protein
VIESPLVRFEHSVLGLRLRLAEIMIAAASRGSLSSRMKNPHPFRHSGLKKRDVHAVGGQVESQAARLRVQLDDNAIVVVPEIGD